MAVNVLVADDSAVMRAMMIRTLRLSGIALGEIHEAADGGDGLRILGSRSVQLVLVDVNMPVMDGLEMLKQARRRTRRKMAVVVVSSDGSERRAAAVRRRGAQFLAKPFAPEDLREAIIRSLGAAHVGS